MSTSNISHIHADDHITKLQYQTCKSKQTTHHDENDLHCFHSPHHPFHR